MQSIQKSRTRRFLLTVTLLTTLLAVSCGKNPDSEQPGGDKPNKEECVPSKCASKRCDPATNKCADADPVFAKADTGGKCTSDDDCLGGSCLKDSRWSDGYCSQQGCTDADSCSKNEGSTVTLGCMASVTGDGGYCIRTCEEDSDCGRENYECVQESGTGYCAMSGTTAISPEAAQKAGEECFSKDGFKNVDPSEKFGWEIEYKTTLPDGVTGFTVNGYVKEMAQGTAPFVIPFTVFNSDGGKKELSSSQYYFKGVYGPIINRVSPIQFPLMPSDESFVKAGELKVLFRTSKNGRPEKFCVVPTFAVKEPGDTLDINLYLVGIKGRDGNVLTSETAAADEDLQKMLNTVRDIYGAQNLNIGEVRYIIPPSSVVKKYTIIRPPTVTENSLEHFDEIARDLVETSRPPTDDPGTPRGINVFLVQQFDGFRAKNSESADRLLGTTTGIPGAALIDGTRASGLVFSAEGLGSDEMAYDFFTKRYDVSPARVLGLTLAHEMGHFLGLFHTTDIGAYSGVGDVSGDPLEKTPLCNRDTIMLARQPDQNIKIIECADAKNFMFEAAIWTNEAYEITEEQKYVMSRSPLFHKNK